MADYTDEAAGKINGKPPLTVEPRESGNELPYPIDAYIENVHDVWNSGFTVPLPATLEYLQPFLESAGITGWQDIQISEVMSDIESLGEVLSESIKRTMSPDTLDELNYLAAKIKTLNNNEYELFVTAVKDWRHCGSAAELINLTENLGNFDLQPAFNAAMLGEHLINMEGDSHGAAFEKLYTSEDEELRGLINYIEYLEKHLDYAAYGKEYAEEEHGVFTKNGYFTEHGEFIQPYRGTQDIPVEYRLFTQPGEIVKPLIKLDDVDIAETLIKLHAVCACGMNDAEGNIKTLRGGQDDFLLTVNQDRILLTPAIDAYKCGDTAGKTVIHWSETPDTKCFAIRVNHSGYDNKFDIRGDFVELNRDALLSNIDRHAVLPDRIDAVQYDGSVRSYNLLEWANVSQAQRSEIKDINMHFPDDALKAAVKRYGSFIGANETVSEAAGLDVLLPEINAAYMAAAANPQPDMIRVTNEASKGILARGETNVYRLAPEGAVKLQPIEAMRSLCFTEHRELAIKREDIGSLDKWSERAAKDITRHTGREGNAKTKINGEEL